MDELAYHTQLLARKTIDSKTQFLVIETLLKTGVVSNESLNLFKVLIDSIKLNQAQKCQFLELVQQYVLHEINKTIITDLIHSSSPEQSQ